MMVTQTLSGLAALAMFGFFIAFLMLMLFMALIQPIWCLVDCAVDNTRGAVAKVTWIIALVVLYGFTNWFYGAFAASGPMLRRLTRIAWVFAIVLVISFLAMFFTHAEFRRGIEQEWHHKGGLVAHAAELCAADAA